MTSPARLPAVLVIMGVSGAGKSTAGENLAAEFGWPFRDADSFHPPENVRKMSVGMALDDADRWPWLAAIAAWIDERRATGQHGIVTCSALKRIYRDRLLAGRDDVRLVYLSGDIELIADRMGRRKNHFMPPALLASQFAALEEPAADENPLIVSIHTTPRRVAEQILAQLAMDERN